MKSHTEGFSLRAGFMLGLGVHIVVMVKVKENEREKLKITCLSDGNACEWPAV